MKVIYSSKKLEKLCNDEREMRRQRADIAAKLKLRINALRVAPSLLELPTLDPLGRWHELTADRSGQWAGSLSRNWRLVIEPAESGDTDVTVLVIDVEDYH